MHLTPVKIKRKVVNMLHDINEAVEFFSKFSNLKRIPQKSQKDCYQAIIDCLNFFHLPRDMDHWKPTTIETYNEFVFTLSGIALDGEPMIKSRLASLLLEILFSNKELRLSVKWFFKKGYFLKFFEKKAENRRREEGRIKPFNWILAKNLHLFVDEELLNELNLFKTRDEITYLENDIRDRLKYQQWNHLGYWNTANENKNREESFCNRWPKIRHDIFWGRHNSAPERLQVEHITLQLQRLQKVLRPLYPIIFEKNSLTL